MKEESNIVYLGVDVAHGHKLPEAIGQMEQFNKVKVKAWFCDIVHTPNQMPFAMQLREELGRRIGQRSPDIKDSDIVICLNIASSLSLRAKDKMYGIINEHQQHGMAKQVNFKGPDGRKQDYEY